MTTINLNTGEGIQSFLFPDNQPHIIVTGAKAGDEVKLTCSITDSIKLLQLLETANALTHLGVKRKLLTIPYLMAARYDRLMQPGDSFDLEVIAGLINSCGFEKVELLDVHSTVALKLINNSTNISNRFLVDRYTKKDAVLICPDKGAKSKINDYLDWNKNLVDVVYCDKSRDLPTGKITLTVTEAEKCRGRNCVIIDDLCDGGGTFLAIAGQIAPAHLTLIVTHGIFSKGFAELEKCFDEIIASNSYGRVYHSIKTSTVSFEPPAL